MNESHNFSETFLLIRECNTSTFVSHLLPAVETRLVIVDIHRKWNCNNFHHYLLHGFTRVIKSSSKRSNLFIPTWKLKI